MSGPHATWGGPPSPLGGAHPPADALAFYLPLPLLLPDMVGHLPHCRRGRRSCQVHRSIVRATGFQETWHSRRVAYTCLATKRSTTLASRSRPGWKWRIDSEPTQAASSWSIRVPFGSDACLEEGLAEASALRPRFAGLSSQSMATSGSGLPKQVCRWGPLDIVAASTSQGHRRSVRRAASLQRRVFTRRSPRQRRRPEAMVCLIAYLFFRGHQSVRGRANYIVHRTSPLAIVC